MQGKMKGGKDMNAGKGGEREFPYKQINKFSNLLECKIFCLASQV